MTAVAEYKTVSVNRGGVARACVANIPGTFNSATSQTLGYDPNGNLASDGTTLYQWDARNRLIGISGDTSATFSYDALDRRMTKSINASTSTYQYDGADVVTEAGATNASYLSTLNIDEPIVRQTSAGNEFYLANDLGSTLALTDDSGAITTSYTYGPFGTTTVNGASTNPVQFTGRENDGTGLYYYRARYYSPSHGRFLAEDPLEFDAGEPNLYAYVANSPLNFSDPYGLEKCSSGAGGLPGSSFGDAAAQYWAAQSVNPNSSAAQAGIASLMGGAAALWTPCTSGKTAMALSAGLGAGAYLGRPYWNYYPKGDPAYPANWLTRGWGWGPPHTPGPVAAQRLGLPPYNPGTAVRPVTPPWRQPVAGPRPVQPANGQPGGGWEYKPGGLRF